MEALSHSAFSEEASGSEVFFDKSLIKLVVIMSVGGGGFKLSGLQILCPNHQSFAGISCCLAVLRSIELSVNSKCGNLMYCKAYT